ncbi:hypothetical protein QE152_g22277 [Popillia japonica]|uniref:Uncharacterized protein n=1 Tax=Popillia japonica TaxID=7064 RepID=A0AAW1KKQ7_POPJA
MFGRNLRTKFDLLVPRTNEIAENNVLRSTELNKQHRRREFVVGDEVLAKDFSNFTWTSGTVIKRDDDEFLASTVTDRPNPVSQFINHPANEAQRHQAVGEIPDEESQSVK